jgi:phosphorylcholine metabolism protein LicD
MFKNFIKNMLYKLKIYSFARELLVKIYYPYRRYLLKKEASSILEKLYAVFSKECSDFWLDYGTLLGFVREKDIIKHDIDLDFGVATNKPDTLSASLQNSGFKLTQQTEVENRIVMQQYSYKGIGFDIFYYAKDGNNIYTYVWLANSYTIPQKEAYAQNRGKLYKIVFGKIETTNIEFLGKKFKIPKDYNSYLIEHYGKDYMQPNPNFSHSDEKNKTQSNSEYKVLFYE